MKIRLPKGYSDEEFQKGFRQWDGWVRWVEDKLWEQGIGTWDISGSAGKDSRPSFRCPMCGISRKDVKSMREIVKHVNSDEHQYQITLAKLSSEKSLRPEA